MIFLIFFCIHTPNFLDQQLFFGTPLSHTHTHFNGFHKTQIGGKEESQNKWKEWEKKAVLYRRSDKEGNNTWSDDKG